MKSIILFCPYFGTLPKGFMKIWEKSWKYNHTIDWLIYTDDVTPYQYPSNVKVVHISFTQFRALIQEKFDFSISLEYPYKLCDYKPMWGYVLEEEFSNYDYWGYFDLGDSVFGDIRQFFYDGILEGFDKYLLLGHFSIYRNAPEVNLRFFENTRSRIELRDVIGVGSGNISYCFDEFATFGINAIYYENGYPIKRMDEILIDISPSFYEFRESRYDGFKPYIIEYEPFVLEWDNGRLYKVSIKSAYGITRHELCYAHLQKRKVSYFLSGDEEKFIITPEGFIKESEPLTVETIKKYSKKRKVYFHNYSLRWKNLMFKLKNISNKIAIERTGMYQWNP